MNLLATLSAFFFDWRGRLGKTRALLLGCAICLTTVGIAFVHSTTAGENDAFPSELAANQLGKAGVGLLVLLLVIAIDYRLIERAAYLTYAGLLVVLMSILISKKISGDHLQRWVQIGFLSIQPSELMKIALVLALARYLKFRSDMRSLAGLIVPFLLTLVPFVLVMAQPNLGTALMLPPILLAVLFVGGARRTHLGAALLLVGLFFPAALLASRHLDAPLPGLRDYQLRRLTAFIDRDQKANAGYQLRESLIAFEKGGATGRGYHKGTQNGLGFLPAKHTDFIFAIIGEEWGFAGAAGVVAIFFLLVVLCLRVALHTREPFGRLMCAAIAIGFAAQGLENFGMTLGLTPITGVPLPFVSFGGSSLVTSFLALALVLNVAFRRVRVVASQDLNPTQDAKVLVVVDDHPAGAQRFPDR
jgi:rod shape determining protein RodA